MDRKISFDELSIEDKFKSVFGEFEKAIQEKVLYDVLTEFYFADWTRKCDYDKMTSEEVVAAAMNVCKKLEEKYKYSLEDDLYDRGVSNDIDW